MREQWQRFPKLESMVRFPSLALTTEPGTTLTESYSVSGVPAGTYSVDITHTHSGGPINFIFYLDGTQMQDGPGSDSLPGTWTGTFADVSVSGDVFLDVDVYQGAFIEL